MKLQTEVHYRLSSAADFLESVWDGERFIQKFEDGYRSKAPYNILFHLQTVSILLSLADFLGRPNLKHVADEAIKNIDSSLFTKGESMFFVYETESAFIWNAFCSVIYTKLGQFEKASSLANSLIECASDEKVSAKYPPDETTTGSISPALLALLILHGKTDNQKLLEAAAYFGEHCLKSAADFDPYTVWGLTLLHKHDPDERYVRKAKQIIKLFKSVTIKGMSSLIAANAQQTCLAAYPHSDWIAGGTLGMGSDYDTNNYHRDLLDQQVAHQIDKDKLLGWNEKFSGAFVKRIKKPEIRIDYTNQNAMALMEYLSFLRGDLTPAII